MLTYLDALILGIIQGIGEFLPISSSAHIVLAEHFLALPSDNRGLEISLHLGTLLAVGVYFFPTFCKMGGGLIQTLFGKKPTLEGKLAWCVIIGTLPALGIGYVLHMVLPALGQPLLWMGASSILCGALLFFIDKGQPQSLTLKELSYVQAFLMGIFQCVAFIPGASRLGMTLLGGRLLGFTREAALVFSYWLSAPVVLGALTLHTYKALKDPAPLLSLPLALGVLTAFLVGLAVIHTLVRWIHHHSFAVIMVYRIIFGGGLLYLALSA